MIGNSGDVLLSFTGYGETAREAMERATAAATRHLASATGSVDARAISHALTPLSPHALLADTAGSTAFAATILILVAPVRESNIGDLPTRRQ